MRRLNLALILALVMAGCTSSQFVQTNITAENQHQMPVYISNEMPQRQYEVIGHIETSGSIFSSHESLLEGLREKAKEVGADAVIKTEFKYFSHVITSIPYVDGIAVKWKEFPLSESK